MRRIEATGTASFSFYGRVRYSDDGVVFADTATTIYVGPGASAAVSTAIPEIYGAHRFWVIADLQDDGYLQIDELKLFAVPAAPPPSPGAMEEVTGLGTLVSGGDSYPGQGPEHAFNAPAAWYSGPSSVATYVGRDLATARSVRRIDVTGTASFSFVGRVKYSDDGTTWTTTSTTVDVPAGSTAVRSFPIQHSGPHRFWAVFDLQDDAYLQVDEIRLFAAVASVPAHTVAGGAYHSLVVTSDGEVWAFGYNGVGSVGDGTLTNRSAPVQVNGLSDVVAVAAGEFHSMAITSTGALFVWGYNAQHQLGDGTTINRHSPVQSTLTDVVAIAAGKHHSLALRSNGEIYGWGANGSGQLGTGNTIPQTSPVLVATGGAAVGAGGEHSIFVKADGSVHTTGYNPYGALGDGTTTQRTSPVPMVGISTAVAAAGGAYHTLVLLSDGSVKAAGYNSEGELGDGTTTARSTAVTIAGLSTVTAISAGQFHSHAVLANGTITGWGYNVFGQIGDGTTTNRYAPTALSSVSSMATIGTGATADHSIAVSSTGVVSTWGRNNYSQLGDGTTTNRSTPNAISAEGYAWKVASPAFSPGAGTYSSNLNVTVSTATSGATIHYTLNGNEPTTADATVTSGSTVAITATTTLKAKAFKTGMATSSTTSAAYVLQVGNPSFSPNSGTYPSAQSVTIATSTTGATIRYTTDGSTPSASSTLYTGPLSVGTSAVVKAIALKTDWSDSAVSTSTYTMNFGTLATPSADQATGTYVDAVTVALSATAGTTIRYTTTNTAVQTTSTVYATPLALDVTTTLRFKAFHPDYAASSEVTRTYTITLATPAFTPTAGNYVGGQEITVTAATPGSTIHYTINGGEPTTSDPIIASGSTLVAGNYTLKAKAFKTGTTPSATTTAAYTISGTVTPPAIAAGRSHSLAIRGDGVSWGWGENQVGQLGIGASTGDQILPVIVQGLTGAVAIDAGGAFSHALKNTGTFVGFGANDHGRLGDGTTTVRYLPETITGVSGIVAVSNGEDHAVALKGDGAIFGWGNNFYGQVGDSSTTTRTSPTLITGVSSVSAVSAGESFSLALKQDGSIASWGRNNSGQLGNGSTTNSSSPVPVSSITTATAVSAGFQHALALLADNTLRAWGNNTWGQIGDGFSGSSYSRLSPVAVAGLDDVIAIAAGGAFSLGAEE